MIDALHVVRFSLRDFWDNLIFLIVLNILWSLTVLLPIIPLFALGSVDLVWVLFLSFFLFLPLPIVSAALCLVTNQVSRGRAIGPDVFVTGLRRYWAKSLAVALINLVVLFIFAANLLFYSSVLEGSWTLVALVVWGVVIAYWLLIQLFWFPMILELENEKVLLALRNAAAMVIITPGFSLTCAIVIVMLAAVSVVLMVPAMLLSASFFLLMANHATRSRLAFVQKEPYRPGLGQD